MSRNAYTRREDDYIRAHCQDQYIDEISMALGRSVGGIRQRAVIIGVQVRYRRQEHRPWSDDEVEELRQMVRHGHTNVVIAERTGRSLLSIAGACKRFRIRRPRTSARSGRVVTGPRIVRQGNVTIHRLLG